MADKIYKEIKTKSYDRAAVDRYNEKFDRFSLNLPKGTKERMQAVGFTAQDRAEAVLKALAEKENKQ